MDSLVRAGLLASQLRVQAGQELLLAVRLDLAPGWYVYWDEPGDSGLPTRIELRAPGLVLGAPRWPVPEEWAAAGGIRVLGHHDRLTVLIPARVAEGPPGSLQVQGEVAWLSCRADACVPGSAPLALELRRVRRARAAAPPPEIAQALAEAPRPVALRPVEGEPTAWIAELPAEGEVRLFPGRALVAAEARLSVEVDGSDAEPRGAEIRGARRLLLRSEAALPAPLVLLARVEGPAGSLDLSFTPPDPERP